MSHSLELFTPTHICLEITLPLKSIIKISHNFSYYCKMGYRSVQERLSDLSVCTHHQVPYITCMVMLEVMTICNTVKCAEILVVVFTSSCHKELITSRKKRRKYGNWPEILFTQDASCASNPLRLSMKGQT
jgi:hypothetical protein